MIMQEIWKDIVGFEGKYRISNTGKVLSLHYCGRDEVRELTPKISNKGYAWVQLEKGNRTHACRLIHRLVAEAFIENPNNEPIINHKDENPLNNNVDNLEWCDYAYNNRYYRERHPRPKRPERPKRFIYHKRLGLKIIQLSLNGEFVKEWSNSRAIYHETGMSEWSISECCRGNRKTAYGFKWRYKDAV